MPKLRPADWQNRIIGCGEKPANEFTLNPHNPRQHPKTQGQALAASLSRLGWIAPVIENVRTGRLIDGHERVAQAQADNAPVPYVQVDLDPDEEQYALLTFDPISAMADYDPERLGELLREVTIEDDTLRQAIFSLAADVSVPPPNDPYAEWVGMPEFAQENIQPFHSIRVHFLSEDAMQAFAALIGQTVTSRTRFIYYPYRPPDDAKRCRVIAHEP